jgi:hypothetical protein
MTFYERKTRTKVSQVVENQALLRRALKLLYAFKNVKPSVLKDRTLLDYHRKTHMLYAANIKRQPIPKVFINQIVDLHDKFVKELLRRNMKHNTPLKKV